MRVKCENIVRCGNYSCCHNTDGYFCNRKVVALDVTGSCAFYKPKVSAPTVCNTATKPLVAFDFDETSK